MILSLGVSIQSQAGCDIEVSESDKMIESVVGYKKRNMEACHIGLIARVRLLHGGSLFGHLDSFTRKWVKSHWYSNIRYFEGLKEIGE